MVKDGVISVCRPGTSLAADYKCQSQTRQLVRKHSWVGPNVNSPEVREFVAQAGDAAYCEARELSWIDSRRESSR